MQAVALPYAGAQGYLPLHLSLQVAAAITAIIQKAKKGSNKTELKVRFGSLRIHC